MMITVTMIITIVTKMNNTSATNLDENEKMHQVIYLIKHKNDYANAAKIMIENHLSIETLKVHTLKLTQIEFAKLADSIIESRK